ncbi:MAG TPA: FAD-binding oxidoreductase [Bryobacteraceae bacterium]
MLINSSALESWNLLLGREFVQLDRSVLTAAETATFATRQHIPAILRPADRGQVQECLRIANRFSIPVYPISSGMNWGYGSRVPPTNGCALLDLSRLNRILDFNEKLGYVTVEPGVTQRQLYAFLEERGSGLWMDSTGSSPDCSLIGNVMERGFGHTPYGDHFAHVCGLEVVLPQADVIETGFARFPDCVAAATGRWGVGPSLDGLFSQSNLGIVTRMSIWLMPRPDSFEAFFFRCEDNNGLPNLIDALRELRLRDVLRSSIHIANDYKVLGGLRQYPWEETKGATPLGRDLMAKFRKELNFGFWNASGGLYGTAAQVAEAKRLLRKSLAPQNGKLKFLSEKKLQLAGRFAKFFVLFSGWDIRNTIALVKPVLGLMQGVPTGTQLASTYWRKRTAPPADPHPDRDRCGLLWYAPVASADGAQVARLTELASTCLIGFGFEPMISLTMLTPRMVCSVLSVAYDREVAGQDEQAMACYTELARVCAAAGYHPYRLGIQSMGAKREEEEAYAKLLGAVKTTVDPNGILAPDRYQN